jgi:hypothetical protein
MVSVGCTRLPATEAELNSYILDPDNKLCSTIEKNGFQIQAIYRPKDLVLAQQIRTGNKNQSQVDSIREQISQYEYFSLKLSKNGRELPSEFVNDPAKFNSIIDYMSFEIGNDLRLIAGQDTIHTEDFIHTRTFGVSTASEVLAAFKYRIPDESSIVALLFDDPLFKTGLSEFRFSTNSIQSIPPLDLNH